MDELEELRMYMLKTREMGDMLWRYHDTMKEVRYLMAIKQVNRSPIYKVKKDKLYGVPKVKLQDEWRTKTQNS